jgi:hypothetical protein
MTCFNYIVDEVNDSRPVLINLDLNTGFGYEGHSECAVAYNQAALEVGAHNTWDSGIDWVSYTLLTDIITVHPGGGGGFPIEITHPTGDTTYYNTEVDEIFYAGDVYEIRWDHENNPTSYVKLQYSSDGGLTWNLIINNTENDGVFDWVVPTGFVSSACRVRTIVYDASGIYAGSDASGGNFTIMSGGSIEVLNSDVYTDAETDPDYYQFTHNYSTWCAVGVRSSYQWKIQMFSNLTFTPPDIASSGANSTVNFVVMDGNHTASVPRGIKVNKVDGVNAYVEFEGGNEELTPGTTSSFTWNATDIVKMWDVHLTPGIYQFSLNVNSPYADLSFALYSSNGTSYFGSKASHIAISNSGSSGEGESFVITITDTDIYGLCVWANDGWSNTSFDISISEGMQWTGTISNNWHNPNNWNPNIVPTSLDDVTIDTGYTYFPIISNEAAYCNNLILKSGAKLRVAPQELNVGGNLVIHGQLEENNSNSDIIVGGNVIWESGSTANFTANGSMHMGEGNWVFKNGANAVLANGTVYFTGINTTNIKSYEANCAFKNIVNEKVAGSLNFSESTDTLKINGYFTNYHSTSHFNIWAEDPLVLKGALNNNGHLYCHAGKFIFGGTTPYINLNTGDYFNNFSLRSAGTVFLADSLRVKGNLAIETGSLFTSNFPIVIEGNWINNVGPSGFNCGFGDVIFQGSTPSKILSNETFYHMIVDKISNDVAAMELAGAKTLHILGDLNVDDGSFLLNGNSVLDIDQSIYIDNGAGVNATASALVRIFIGNSWYNMNTDYTLIRGFNPGEFSQVIFDGTGDQYLATARSAYEEFNTLKINKLSGNFRPLDNLRSNKDIIIQSGTWKDLIVGLTHYVYRNFTVEPAGSLKNDTAFNTLLFMGPDTSLLTYSGTTGSIYHLGISKTGGSAVIQVSAIGIAGNLNIYQGNYTLNGKQLVVVGSMAVSATGILSLPAGSLLKLSNYSSLNINLGGKIDITGTFANPVEIRGKLLTDSYFFNINPNAIIAAEYCTFRNMATEGVNVHHEAFVDPLHSFRSCTFRDGVPGGTLLTINNAQNIVIDSARFNANTWGGASNVIKSMDQEMVTFTNYSGEFSGEDYDNDPFNLIVWEATVPVVPAFTTISGDVVTGEINCYNATNVITVSESPLTFNLHAGGSATFIAGSKIIFKPGTKVFAGGYLHAYITTTGDYCGSSAPSMVTLTDVTEELPDTPVGFAFMIYPNPSDGKFTLAQTGAGSGRDLSVDIYTLSGKLLFSKVLKPEPDHAFNLYGVQAGLYLLRVTDGETSETLKLIIYQ